MYKIFLILTLLLILDHHHFYFVHGQNVLEITDCDNDLQENGWRDNLTYLQNSSIYYASTSAHLGTEFKDYGPFEFLPEARKLDGNGIYYIIPPWDCCSLRAQLKKFLNMSTHQLNEATTVELGLRYYLNAHTGSMVCDDGTSDSCYLSVGPGSGQRLMKFPNSKGTRWNEVRVQLNATALLTEPIDISCLLERKSNSFFMIDKIVLSINGSSMLPSCPSSWSREGERSTTKSPSTTTPVSGKTTAGPKTRSTTPAARATTPKLTTSRAAHRNVTVVTTSTNFKNDENHTTTKSRDVEVVAP